MKNIKNVIKFYFKKWKQLPLQPISSILLMLNFLYLLQCNLEKKVLNKHIMNMTFGQMSMAEPTAQNPLFKIEMADNIHI